MFHTSAMLFWMGVPVSRSLFLHWNPSRIFHRTLEHDESVQSEQHSKKPTLEAKTNKPTAQNSQIREARTLGSA